MKVLNRYTGEVHEELHETGPGEIKKIIDNGIQASGKIAETPRYELSDLLYKISSGIRKDSSSLARNITIETGKPLKYSRQEVERSAQVFVTAAEELKNLSGTSLEGGSKKLLQDHISITSNVPVGLILSVHPFTEPLYSVSSRVAASIATGNAMIMKPSSISPTSSTKLLEILRDAGSIENSIQSVNGSRTGKGIKALMSNDNFSLFAFSGRQESAMEVTKQIGIPRSLLETGSSSPVIVWDDADLDNAAEAIAESAFRFQGQSPIRAQSIIMRNESYEYLKNRLIEISQQLSPGNPLDEETDFGPLINEETAENAENLIKSEEKAGGYILSGGHREKAFLEPTVLDNVKTSSDLVKKQVLAPIITLHQVDSFNDAIKVANETGISTQAGLFASDINLVMSAFDKLDCAIISVNDAPGLPTESVSSSNLKGNFTASKSMRYLMRNMIEEKLAILKR